MTFLDEIKLNSYIEHALIRKSMGDSDLFDYFVDLANPNIEKSKEGYYTNNYVNRKLGIVGQPYKHHKKTEELPELREQTSENLYKEQGVWSRARRIKVHEPIKKKYRDKMVFESKPRAYLMLGGGGSGKGFYLDKLKEQDSSINKLPVLDIDEIRVNDLPDYKRVWDKDKKLAANYVHNEASYLGDSIEKMYILKKSSFIRDAVFSNYEKLEKTVKKLKERGYEVHLIGVATDYDLALKRIEKRFQTKGRWLDPEVAKKGHKGASNTFFEVLNGPLKKEFKEIKLYDGNSDKGIIYDNKVINEKELYRFLSKKDLL